MDETPPPPASSTWVAPSLSRSRTAGRTSSGPSAIPPAPVARSSGRRRLRGGSRRAGGSPRGRWSASHRARRVDAGPGVPLVDGALQTPGRARKIAHGGEAAHQGVLGRLGRGEGVYPGSPTSHPSPASPPSRCASAHRSGRASALAPAIDHGGAGGRSVSADGHDAVALDQHIGWGSQPGSLAVEYAHIAEEGLGRRRRGICCSRRAGGLRHVRCGRHHRKMKRCCKRGHRGSKVHPDQVTLLARRHWQALSFHQKRRRGRTQSRGTRAAQCTRRTVLVWIVATPPSGRPVSRQALRRTPRRFGFAWIGTSPRPPARSTGPHSCRDRGRARCRCLA